MITTLLSLIAPYDCYGCGSEGSALCSQCTTQLPALPSRCFLCFQLTAAYATCVPCRQRSGITKAVFITSYDGVIKQTIHGFKFESKRGIAKDLAKALKQKFELPEDCLLTYIPTVSHHVRERGFDHAKLLAKQYGRLMGAPVTPTLARLKATVQVGASRSSRLANSKYMFTVLHPEKVDGKVVCIVDDVVTTGATVSAAAKGLKKAGARSVYVLAVAQTIQ